MEQINSDDCLVSIIVATYNSEAFVIETLDSAKAQNWQNIELIVSDDCSSDNTVELCLNWIANNKDRFVRTELITVPQNTGISANCNRCIKAARAEWLKFIAGDDLMLPNCIADNVDFIKANPEAKAVFSQVLLYKNDFEAASFLGTIPSSFPFNIMDSGFTALDQYERLLISDRITFTPSVFLNRKVLLDVGGYDERDRLIEDYPMWLKLTKAGNKLFFFDKATVSYRKHEHAASFKNDDCIFKPLILKAAAIRKKNAYPGLPWDIVANEKQVLMFSRFFQKAGMNKRTSINVLLYKICTVYLNPFRYVVYFKKKVLKLGQTNIFYKDTVIKVIS